MLCIYSNFVFFILTLSAILDRIFSHGKPVSAGEMSSKRRNTSVEYAMLDEYRRMECPY